MNLLSEFFETKRPWAEKGREGLVQGSRVWHPCENNVPHMDERKNESS